MSLCFQIAQIALPVALFNFRQAHPDWKCSQSSESLIGAVEEYKNAALSRERDLYIQAATRQLDTLARLQNGNFFKKKAVDDLYPIIDAHVPKPGYPQEKPVSANVDSKSEAGLPGRIPASNETSNDLQRDEGVQQNLLHPGRVLSSSEPLQHTSNISNPLELSAELWRDLNKSTPEAGALSAPSALDLIDRQQQAQRQVGIAYCTHNSELYWPNT